MEVLARGEHYFIEKTLLDLGINFTSILVGNYIGGKLVKINTGWFQPQKFLSVFTKTYGQRILTQAVIGSGLSGGVNFARQYNWRRLLPGLSVQTNLMVSYF